jgi:zinc transporter ZupT
LTEPPTAQELGIAWLLVGLSWLAMALGAATPLLHSVLHKATSKRGGANIYVQLLADLFSASNSDRFLARTLAFSGGVLIYGAFGLILSGVVDLLRPTLGRNAQIVQLGLFLAGWAVVSLISYVTVSTPRNPEKKKKKIHWCSGRECLSSTLDFSSACDRAQW